MDNDGPFYLLGALASWPKRAAFYRSAIMAGCGLA